MSKAWQPYALHILDGIDKINRIQARGDILTDDILYDAILRNLQTLSEATQQLPEQLKQQYDKIPWAQISGFRNILVHNYLGDIDPETILSVVTTHIPPLQRAAAEMIEQSNGPEY